MDLYAWLVTSSEPPVDLSPLPREPPEFLRIQKTKPPRRGDPEGGVADPNSFPLTPLESQLKDIIVNVYSDKKKKRSSGYHTILQWETPLSLSTHIL
jgi:hypothetical protein